MSDNTTKRRYAMSIDTKSMPGSVEVAYVEFTKEVVPLHEFDEREFRLVDPRLPNFITLKNLLKDTPDGKFGTHVNEPHPAPKK